MRFGWEAKGSGYINSDEGTRITLRALEMAQLLEAGAFTFSMNRVKLLLAFDERTEGLREVAQHPAPFQLGSRGALSRWGLVEATGDGYRLTSDGKLVIEAHARLKAEIERVRKVAPHRGITGVKGLPYPDVD